MEPVYKVSLLLSFFSWVGEFFYAIQTPDDKEQLETAMEVVNMVEKYLDSVV